MKIEKKSQGLPLNTIVLAILVILVLVIIIVYFTSNMKKSETSLHKNTDLINGCHVGSYIIPNGKYKDANCKSVCNGNEEKITLAECEDKNKVCCAKKIKNTK